MEIFGQNYSSEFELFVQQSMEGLRLKTSAHIGTWHLDEASWNVDQNEGIITFTASSGIKATCPVQIIGTYNSLDSTFLWGWEHPSVATALQNHAQKVREYGEQQGISVLTEHKITCTEDDAWVFTAVACKLNEAQGAYRGPAGTTFVFMTFDTVQLSKA